MRLFFALWPEPDTQRRWHEELASYVKPLGGRRVPAENLHLTLAFLGEVPGTRINALLRRCYVGQTAQAMEWGPYVFLADQCAVAIDEQPPVSLARKEFELALFMFRNMGRLMSRAHLLEAVWSSEVGEAVEVSSRTLDTHVSRLRSLLRLQPEHGYRLVSVYRQGYRLEAVTSTAAA